MDLIQYIINSLIITSGRILDIWSTYRITPKLKLETNSIIRKLGWKGGILLQFPIIFLGAFFNSFTIFIFVFSFFITAHNISGSWLAKGLGEDEYTNVLKDGLSKIKNLRVIFLDELAPFLIYCIPNIMIWFFLFQVTPFSARIFFENSIITYIFMITFAIFFFGVINTIQNIIYLLGFKLQQKMKKEKPKTI